MLAASHSDGQIDEVTRQLFEALAVGDGLLEGRGVLGREALAEVLALLPNLVFEVRTSGAASRRGTLLGLEGAVFHGGTLGHLLEERFALGVE